ncbi:MAG TPA: type II toxin-antitoxin system RelE/ParE family toxin [Bacillales bacterium]|nr:type II toxin-antitoxin system RelE/ParE family toxin [Bacillales bacterium]
MEHRYQIKYLPAAEQDLDEIIEYIQLDNPPAAAGFLNHLDQSISQLSYFPFIRAIPKDQRLKAFGYRMLIIDIYLVFYVVLQDIVEIRRIIHGKRRYAFLLS